MFSKYLSFLFRRDDLPISQSQREFRIHALLCFVKVCKFQVATCWWRDKGCRWTGANLNNAGCWFTRSSYSASSFFTYIFFDLLFLIKCLVTSLKSLVSHSLTDPYVHWSCCMYFGCAHLLSQVAWNKRDLLAYAVGIGAKNDEFQFIYGTSFYINTFCSAPLFSHTLSRAWWDSSCFTIFRVPPNFIAQFPFN